MIGRSGRPLVVVRGFRSLVDAKIVGWTSDGVAGPWTLVPSDRRHFLHGRTLRRRRNSADGAVDLRAPRRRPARRREGAAASARRRVSPREGTASERARSTEQCFQQRSSPVVRAVERPSR